MSFRGEGVETTKMPTEVNEEQNQSTVSWIFTSIVSGVKNFNSTLTDFVKTIDVVDVDTDTDAEDEEDYKGSTKKQENRLNKEDLTEPET